MLVNTHMLMAQKVYDYVKELLNINLKKNYFIYGNVKPDLAPRLSSMSHRIKDSLDFVIDEIDRLSSNVNTDLQQFSIDLGAVNHLLSDFFCSAHYYDHEKFNRIISHLKYEYVLHNVYKKLDKNGLLELSKLKIDSFVKSSILETILNLERSYKSQISNMENDIYYALRVSTLASIHVLGGSSISFDNRKIIA